MIKIKVHRFICALKKKWLEIEKESHLMPYQTYLIQRIVARRHIVNMIRKRYIPIYCEVKENGKTVMIAPLFQKRRKNGEKVFTSFIGLTGFNIYDFAYKQSTSAEDIKRYLEFMMGELDASQLLMDDIPENSKLYAAINLMREKGYQVSLEPKENVNIHIGTDYDAYFKSLSKHSRQNIRTAYNRLNTDGKSFRMEYIRGKKLDRNMLNRLLRVYFDRRSSKYSVSESPIRAMYMKYLDFSTAYQQNWPDNIYSVIYIDGEIAAFMSGIICEDGKRAIFPDSQ